MKSIRFVTITVILLLSYLNVGQVLAEENTISFTFNVVDWAPITYVDENSTVGYSGIYLDIMNEIFTNRMKINLEYKPLPWKRAQFWVENGMADLIIIPPTEQRLKYAVQSDNPVFELYLNVYTYKGHNKMKEIKQIKSVEDILRLGLIPVTNLGNGWHKENIDSYGIQTHYVGEDDQIASFLALKRADIMIDAFIPMNYIINKLGLASKIEVTDVRFGPIKFYLLMSKKSKYIDLMPEINNTINSLIEDGTLNKINNKYSTLE